jgi:hypothetical protein
VSIGHRLPCAHASNGMLGNGLIEPIADHNLDGGAKLLCLFLNLLYIYLFYICSKMLGITTLTREKIKKKYQYHTRISTRTAGGTLRKKISCANKFSIHIVHVN